MTELSGGVGGLGFAFLQWEQMRSPAGAVWHQMYFFVIYVAALGAALHYGNLAIKERITYRRTGFVEYRKEGRIRTRVLTGIGAPLFLLVVLFANRRHWNVNAAPALFGLGAAAAYAIRFAAKDRWKFAVAVAVALCSLEIALHPADLTAALGIGSWTSFSPFEKVFATEIFILTLCGAAALVSGAISLWLYLRHTQPPAPEEP